MHEFVYRPQHKPKEELAADFVLRVTEFEKLMRSIRSESKDILPQHWLIHGKRGMGKTTLMHRAFYEVQDELRSKGIVAVMFSEEQYGVRMLYKLWEQTAIYLEENESEYRGIWYEMQDAQETEDYTEKCFEILQNKVEELGHRLVLFIDNFGVMVDKFSKNEQQRFREILLTFPGLKIIGGSAVMLESFYKYDKPFFDFFKVMSLKSLSPKEVKTLLLQLDKKETDSAIEEIVKNQPGRLEAMRILTGGVPRTIVLLFSIFLDRDQGNSIDDLKKLLDDVTPLYKHRMDELPAQQQEIVDKLAWNWDGMSTGELVKVTRMESKALSAQLNQLVKAGTVIKIKSTGKNHFYQLEERFFNIWYLMQHAPRGARQKVVWLTRFLEVWCDEKSLEVNAKSFSKRLREEQMHKEYANAMTYAYATAQGLSRKTRDEVIVAAETTMAEEPLMKYGDWQGKFNALLDEEKWIQARAWLEKGMLPESSKLFYKGLTCDEGGDFFNAKELYLKAVEKGHTDAMFNLALLYKNEFQNYEKAEQYFLQAVDKGHSGAMSNLVDMVIIHDLRKYTVPAKKWIVKLDSQRQDVVLQLLLSKALFWIEDFQEGTIAFNSLLTLENLEEYTWAFENILQFILAKGLKNYAYKLFQKPELQLMDRFKVHYYALMKLLEDEYPNEIRRMGKELEEPVMQMVEEIKKMEKKYAA